MGEEAGLDLIPQGVEAAEGVIDFGLAPVRIQVRDFRRYDGRSRPSYSLVASKVISDRCLRGSPRSIGLHHRHRHGRFSDGLAGREPLDVEAGFAGGRPLRGLHPACDFVFAGRC